MTVKKIDAQASELIKNEKTIVVSDESTEKYINENYKYFADDIRAVYLSDVTSWATARKMGRSALLCLCEGKRVAMDELSRFVNDSKFTFAHGAKKALKDSMYDFFAIELNAKAASIPSRLYKGDKKLTEDEVRSKYGSSLNLKFYVRNAKKQAQDAKAGKKDANGKAITAPKSVIRATADANTSLFEKGAKKRVTEIVTGLKSEVERFSGLPINKKTESRRADIIAELTKAIKALEDLELFTLELTPEEK